MKTFIISLTAHYLDTGDLKAAIGPRLTKIIGGQTYILTQNVQGLND